MKRDADRPGPAIKILGIFGGGPRRPRPPPGPRPRLSADEAAVLRTIGMASEPLTIRPLAQLSGLPEPIAHTLVKRLLGAQLVHLASRGSRYRPGYALTSKGKGELYR